MLTELIIGVIVATSFLIGAFIYSNTKIELDQIADKINIKRLRKVWLVSIPVLSICLLLFNYAIVIFSIGLVLTTLISSKHNDPIKYGLACSGIFIATLIAGILVKSVGIL